MTCKETGMNRYLTVNRLEFLVTYLCSGSCRNCYATKYEERQLKHVDECLAVNIVQQVGETYHPQSIMTFGGEPLLFPDVTCSIHKAAADLGVPSRQLITNGFWSDSLDPREIAAKLAESGVNNISFSVDAFHQEYIPINIVRKAVEACLEVGIEGIAWNPCWVISKDDDNEYNQRTKSILKDFKDLSIRESKGNVVEPVGLALVNLKDFFPPKVQVPKGKCGDLPYTEQLDNVKSISVEPDGRIAICNNLYIGDASKRGVLDILKSYDPYKVPEIETILEEGIEGLLNYAKLKGVEPNLDGYFNICHMCSDLRRKLAS